MVILPLVTRIFCSTCGSPVAHKSKAFGDSMAIRACSLLQPNASIS